MAPPVARCDSLAPVTNPHAGLPITDDDATIAAALEDVSVPALMCSMVHLTGDPAWVRGDLRPTGLFLNEYQGFMDEESKAEARRRAFAGFCVDNGLMAVADPSAIVLHCLPAHRDEEISDEVIEGPQSVVWRQAENRLHSQKALLEWALGD